MEGGGGGVVVVEGGLTTAVQPHYDDVICRNGSGGPRH